MILKACGVSKNFFRDLKSSNYFTAVDNASIELRQGELSMIMGRSGSGKSTLLNMMAGLILPTSGEVLADDINIYSLNDEKLSFFRNKHIGVIPQGESALYNLSVSENVKMPYMLYNNKGDEINEQALKLLSEMGIENLKDERPSNLSGGELRRMSIARALVSSPDFILADEPTGDLDEENTKIVLKILRKYADNGGSVLIVTHESDAAIYADKLYKMDGGILSLN